MPSIMKSPTSKIADTFGDVSLRGSHEQPKKHLSKKRKSSDNSSSALHSRKRAKLIPSESRISDANLGSTRPMINKVPCKPLKIFMCGSGDSVELGFGRQSDNETIEAKTPRLNPLLSGIIDIAVGGMHGIALSKDNEILTWGVDDDFALGRDTLSADDGTEGSNSAEETDEATPTILDKSAFPADTIFVQVSAGDSASFALTTDGLVYGWGLFRDTNDPFGFNVTSSREVSKQPQRKPKLIEGLRNIKQIACGSNHVLALDQDGSVFAWGAGEHAQLGRVLLPAHIHKALTPLRMRIPRPIVYVAAGADHSFAVDKDGHVWSWGLNNFGQCGIVRNAGQANAIIPSPQLIKTLMPKRIKMIAGGNAHSIAITQDGECMTWGKMADYQSGIDMDTLLLDDAKIVMKSQSGRPYILLYPTRVPNVKNASYVAAGSDHCLAITDDGEAFSWGFNMSNQCGQIRASRSNNEEDEDDLDEIREASQIDSGDIVGEHLVWAGAGGQFSALAAIAEVQNAS